VVLNLIIPAVGDAGLFAVVSAGIVTACVPSIVLGII
jgi:hypothetical protein